MKTKNKKLSHKVFQKAMDDFFWKLVGIPKKGEFVLVSDSPYQDFPEPVQTSKDKDALIAKGKKMTFPRYSSIVIYDHNKKEVWNANLPSTM